MAGYESPPGNWDASGRPKDWNRDAASPRMTLAVAGTGALIVLVMVRLKMLPARGLEGLTTAHPTTGSPTNVDLSVGSNRERYSNSSCREYQE
jgi:hypothetical protein